MLKHAFQPAIARDTVKWEKYAKRDAEFSILTQPEIDYRSSEGREFFFRSGVEDSRRSLERIQHLLPGRKRCVDLGCGIGRLALPHARSFTEVYAVDISATMLVKLHLTCEENAVRNVRPFLVDEDWDEEKATDYVYSFMVFQHISDFNLIVEHLRRIQRTLKPNGIAQLHFDTRPANVWYNIRNRVPDILLPMVYRRGIRRVRRSSADLMNAFRNAGLRVVEASGVASFWTIYVLTPEYN